MKKILFIFVVILSLTGCTSEMKMKGEITEIKYNDVTILEDEYDNIKDLINTKFSNEKHKIDGDLTIKTTEDIYYFKVSDKYLGYNGKYAENKKIGPYLKQLKEKYHNTDFYDINYEENYINAENDLNINLDKTSNYIVIKLNGMIKDFKINEIEYEDDTYKDIDLLYEKDEIDNQAITIRKSVNYGKPDIRISFSNPYNYRVSIVPIYEDEEIKFDTKYEMKDSK